MFRKQKGPTSTPTVTKHWRAKSVTPTATPSSTPTAQTIPQKPKPPKPNDPTPKYLVPANIYYSIDSECKAFPDNTYYYFYGFVYHMVYEGDFEEATKIPPWGSEGKEPEPLSPNSLYAAKAAVNASLENGKHRATFIVYDSFEEGWNRFNSLLKAKKKRTARAICYVYNAEIKRYLLGLERCHPSAILYPDNPELTENSDVFALTPKSQFEFLSRETTPMSKFVKCNPCAESQVIVKEISESFEDAVLNDLSIDSLDNISSYVTCDDGLIKVFTLHSKADLSANANWSDCVKKDIGGFKKGVDDFLIPGTSLDGGIVWQQKTEFLKCFDLVPTDGKMDKPFIIIYDNPFLMVKVNDILKIVWQADHVIKNHRTYHPKYGKVNPNMKEDNLPDIDYFAFMEYVDNSAFMNEICPTSKMWLVDGEIVNPKLKDYLLAKYVSSHDKRNGYKYTSFNQVRVTIRSDPKDMIKGIRDLYQHLDDNSMGLHMLLNEVNRVWPKLISRLHAKLHERKT